MRRFWKRILLFLGVFLLMTMGGCSGEEEITLEEAQEVPKEAQGEEAQRDPAQKEPGETDGEKDGKNGSIYVHVCGQVADPGVYELPQGSRVYQALEAAGGMTEQAAEQFLNQALALEDGQQVYVPSREEAKTAAAQGSAPGQTAAAGGVATGPGGQDAGDGKVNLNTATKEELMTLSGIGEVRAEAILNYREANGGFQSIEELKEIEGIKEGVFGKIEDQIKI